MLLVHMSILFVLSTIAPLPPPPFFETHSTGENRTPRRRPTGKKSFPILSDAKIPTRVEECHPSAPRDRGILSEEGGITHRGIMFAKTRKTSSKSGIRSRIEIE